MWAPGYPYLSDFSHFAIVDNSFSPVQVLICCVLQCKESLNLITKEIHMSAHIHTYVHIHTTYLCLNSRLCYPHAKLLHFPSNPNNASTNSRSLIFFIKHTTLLCLCLNSLCEGLQMSLQNSFSVARIYILPYCSHLDVQKLILAFTGGEYSMAAFAALKWIEWCILLVEMHLLSWGWDHIYWKSFLH